MQCEQFEATWQRLLDEHRSPHADPHLLAHSLVCPHCANLLESTDSLLWGLENDVRVSPDFADQVVARATKVVAVAPPAPSRARTGSAMKRGWWLLAAMALGMVLLTRFSTTRDPGPTAPAAVEVATTQPRQGAKATDDAQQAADAQEKDAQGKNEQDVQLRELWIELAERFPKDEATKAITTHIQRLDSATRPLARSFGTAFTAIYRSVGKSADSDKSALLMVGDRSVA